MEQIAEAILEIEKQMSFNALIQSLGNLAIVICLIGIMVSNRN